MQMSFIRNERKREEWRKGMMVGERRNMIQERGGERRMEREGGNIECEGEDKTWALAHSYACACTLHCILRKY